MKGHTSFLISEEAKALLKKLSHRKETSMSAILEIIIRDYAKKEGVSVQVQKDA